MGYFGDFGFVPPLPVTEEALPASAELNEVFGFEPKLSKSEGGPIHEFLGLVIDQAPYPGNPPL